jgi:hypothetical protein
MHGAHITIKQAGTIELTEDRRDATRPMNVFHVVVAVGRHLAQARDAPADGIDVVDRERDLRLLCRSQDVQHRVR